MSDVRVNRSLVIPEEELALKFSTSSGPGGQHANKVATRVDVTWNIDKSESVGPRQRERIRTALASRINSSGELRVTSNRFRSQVRNREDALERLADLVGDALKVRATRKRTEPSRAAKEKRLEAKRRRSETKRRRRPPPPD